MIVLYLSVQLFSFSGKDCSSLKGAENLPPSDVEPFFVGLLIKLLNVSNWLLVNQSLIPFLLQSQRNHHA